jgi:hypothetical protein
MKQVFWFVAIALVLTILAIVPEGAIAPLLTIKQCNKEYVKDLATV